MGSAAAAGPAAAGTRRREGRAVPNSARRAAGIRPAQAAAPSSVRPAVDTRHHWAAGTAQEAGSRVPRAAGSSPRPAAGTGRVGAAPGAGSRARRAGRSGPGSAARAVGSRLGLPATGTPTVRGQPGVQRLAEVTAAAKQPVAQQLPPRPAGCTRTGAHPPPGPLVRARAAAWPAVSWCSRSPSFLLLRPRAGGREVLPDRTTAGSARMRRPGRQVPHRQGRPGVRC